MHYVGIDIGTSGVKTIVCDASGLVIDSESHALSVSSLHPKWSEQNPADWWHAIDYTMTALGGRGSLKKVKAIGLAGQMHGAVLIDGEGEVIRPAILWNDGRSEQQCVDLMAACPDATKITGNLIMPGFTAPKVRWVREVEPDNFARISKVLLPKDYVRYLLTGAFASDMSDAAGTCWMDTQQRDWSDELLAACGLSRENMPELVEGPASTGVLSKHLAEQWHMPEVQVVGGAGDNAAGAIGSGITEAGQAMISLGTSGVIFAVTDRFVANPDAALHSFCHAIPDKWHAMSVHLSAASCLQWFANIAAAGDVQTLLDELGDSPEPALEQNCYFIPYLSGERTPHNNPSLTGRFCGLTHNTSRKDMTYAVLEGVAFSFKDGLQVMQDAGVTLDSVSVIGGGARSRVWRQLIADVLGIAITYRKGGEVGPALGAAKLALLNEYDKTDIQRLCPVPDAIEQHVPNKSRYDLLNRRYGVFKELAQQQ